MQVRTSRSGPPGGAAGRTSLVPTTGTRCAEAGAARGLEEARRGVDAARVGERQRVVAERGGALDQILRQRGAGEEAERAPAAQLDVVGHEPLRSPAERQGKRLLPPTSRSAAALDGKCARRRACRRRGDRYAVGRPASCELVPHSEAAARGLRRRGWQADRLSEARAVRVVLPRPGSTRPRT